MFPSSLNVRLGSLGLVCCFMTLECPCCCPTMCGLSLMVWGRSFFPQAAGWSKQWRKGGIEPSFEEGLWELLLTLHWLELSYVTPLLPMCLVKMGWGLCEFAYSGHFIQMDLQYMAFCVWLLSLNVFFQCSYAVACMILHSFFDWIKFHYMDITYSVYPFIGWWMFGLFLLFGYYEQCCCEHSHTSLCMNIYFQSSWEYT